MKANTRADGEALLRQAAAAKVKPLISTYPLAEANQALRNMKAGRIDDSAVLQVAG